MLRDTAYNFLPYLILLNFPLIRDEFRPNATIILISCIVIVLCTNELGIAKKQRDLHVLKESVGRLEVLCLKRFYRRLNKKMMKNAVF